MTQSVTMNQYNAMGATASVREVRGRNRNRHDEYGVQRTVHEQPRPLGLEIKPFKVERRGNRFLCRVETAGDVPFHFVRVYEDGVEERI